MEGNVAQIFLNNITDETIHWSLDYGSDNTDGDQQGKSFQSLAVPFAEKYTVCYWKKTDPDTRHCVTLGDGDAATYTGKTVVRTLGG